jgi:hypothetical protein
MRFARFVLPLLLIATPALAQEGGSCPLPARATPELAAYDDFDRYSFLRDRIHQSATHAAIYMGGWATVYGATAVTQFALIPAADAETRKDRILGGSAAAFGMIFALVPPRILIEDGRLRSAESIGVCGDIARVEAALDASIRDEDFANSPLMHAGNFLFNMGLGLIIGVGFHHVDVAILTATSGVFIGEVQFYTRPHTSRADLDDYLNGALHPRSVGSRFNWAAAPIVRPDGGGMSFALTF